MSEQNDFLAELDQTLEGIHNRLTVKRAVVVDVAGGKAKVKRDDALAADSQYYPVLGDEYLTVDDEVALVPLGASPVVIGPLMRTARTLIPYGGVRVSHGERPGASLGAASAGGSISNAGTDAAGRVNVTVGGSPSTGELFTVTFANALPSSNYEVLLTPRSTNAGASVWRVSTLSSIGFTVSIAAAPSGGSAVNFSYAVLPWVEG